MYETDGADKEENGQSTSQLGTVSGRMGREPCHSDKDVSDVGSEASEDDRSHARSKGISRIVIDIVLPRALHRVCGGRWSLHAPVPVRARRGVAMKGWQKLN